ncbi:MAG: HEPN domain-containing protein, partial [Treponema sp.]|nr:HEPN domain-containing protein [Treponema sp.]
MICFHCQQAAEKYLKGFLVFKGIEFPKTHDLAALLKLANTGDVDFSILLDKCLFLLPFGVEPR